MTNSQHDRVESLLRALGTEDADDLGVLDLPDGELAVIRLGRGGDRICFTAPAPSAPVVVHRVHSDPNVTVSGVVALLDGMRLGSTIEIEHVWSGSDLMGYGLVTSDLFRVITQGAVDAFSQGRPDFGGISPDLARSYAGRDPHDEAVSSEVLYWLWTRHTLGAQIVHADTDGAPMALIRPFCVSPLRAMGVMVHAYVATDEDGSRALVLDVSREWVALHEGRVHDDPFSASVGAPLDTSLAERPTLPGVWIDDWAEQEDVPRRVYSAPWSQVLNDLAASTREDEGLFHVGNIHAPSGQLAISDPIDQERLDTIDVAIPPERQLPVYAIIQEYRPTGLLVRLGNGAPSRWVAAATDTGVWSSDGSGVIALMDAGSRQFDPDRDLIGVPSFGTADLTGTGAPSLAWITDIEGDVPVGLLAGLDVDDRLVALLIDVALPHEDHLVTVDL